MRVNDGRQRALLVIGSLTIPLGSIVSRTLGPPDFVTGLICGAGIGLLILGLVRQQRACAQAERPGAD